jgi:hypothetical protein
VVCRMTIVTLTLACWLCLYVSVPVCVCSLVGDPVCRRSTTVSHHPLPSSLDPTLLVLTPTSVLYTDEAIFYGIMSSNHPELMLSYPNPMLDFIPSAKQYAAAKSMENVGRACGGLHFPDVLAPWGAPESGDGVNADAGLMSNGCVCTKLTHGRVETCNATTAVCPGSALLPCKRCAVSSSPLCLYSPIRTFACASSAGLTARSR